MMKESDTHVRQRQRFKKVLAGQRTEVVNTDPVYRHLHRESAEMINTVTKSNIRIEEGKERINMCQAIQDMMAESEAKGRAEGVIEMLVSLFKKGILTLAQAAEEAKMSPEEFQLKVAEQQ